MDNTTAQQKVGNCVQDVLHEGSIGIGSCVTECFNKLLVQIDHGLW